MTLPVIHLSWAGYYTYNEHTTFKGSGYLVSIKLRHLYLNHSLGIRGLRSTKCSCGVKCFKISWNTSLSTNLLFLKSDIPPFFSKREVVTYSLYWSKIRDRFPLQQLLVNLVQYLDSWSIVLLQLVLDTLIYSIWGWDYSYHHPGFKFLLHLNLKQKKISRHHRQMLAMIWFKEEVLV